MREESGRKVETSVEARLIAVDTAQVLERFEEQGDLFAPLLATGTRPQLP